VPVNSTGGAFTITMPASAAAQARVIIMDVGKACGTNNVTLDRNGATFDSVAEDFVINQNHGRVDASSNGSDDWSTHLIGSPDIISANTVFIVYKNVNYTVQPGERVMVDSAVAGLTITLPLAPVAGASVGVWDAGNNASVNTVAIARNGQTIDGVAADDVLDISAGHFEFVFNGSTWKRSFWAPGGLALADVVGTQTDYYDAASGRLIAWLASGASGPTYQEGGANSAQPYMFIALPDSGQPNATLNTVLPKRWNVGQVRVRFFWKQAVAGAGAIVLGFGTNSANDNESMLGAIGGYGSVTDTAPNDINKIMVTGWTSSAVVTDAPTAGALIQFYLYRQPANVLDTLATTVRLLGVELEWTSNAATDA